MIKLLNMLFILGFLVSEEEDSISTAAGFTLVEIMIVLMLIASLAVLAIPNLLRARMTANESAARATLKTIAVGFENHALESAEGYPTDFSALIAETPPYLNKDYIAESPIQGYNYSCSSLTESSYSCSAQPQYCNQTGSKVYTITTGAVFSETTCN